MTQVAVSAGSKSASADIGGELTVLSQVARCLTTETLENHDGDLEVDMHVVVLAGAQWSCRSIGVMWSCRGAPVISRAAGQRSVPLSLISLSGKPCNIALQ